MSQLPKSTFMFFTKPILSVYHLLDLLAVCKCLVLHHRLPLGGHKVFLGTSLTLKCIALVFPEKEKE